jgi:hypothetical protein
MAGRRTPAYEPTTEKIMRLHAQTAIIENGFVHIPDTAPWLAEYLHEMTVFPKGKHDDQVDSTAQFLDWFKRPSPGWAYFECMRMQMQAQQNAGNPERHRVCLRAAGDVASVQTLSGRHIIIGPDRTVEVSAEDAEPLIPAGWTELGGWIDDDPAEYKHINKPNAAEGPQITCAVGSMEWRASGKRASRSQSGLARRGEEEIGPPYRIFRQKNVNPLFPLRSDVGGDRGAKRFRRSAAFNPTIRYTDAAVIGLDSAPMARSGGPVGRRSRYVRMGLRVRIRFPPAQSLLRTRFDGSGRLTRVPVLKLRDPSYGPLFRDVRKDKDGNGRTLSVCGAAAVLHCVHGSSLTGVCSPRPLCRPDRGCRPLGERTGWWIASALANQRGDGTSTISCLGLSRERAR